MNTSKLLLSKISLLLNSLVKSNQSKANVSHPEFPLLTFSHPEFSEFESFLIYIDSAMETSAQIYLFSLCLLKRLEKTEAFTQLTSQTVQGVFYACFCIAYKYLEDEVYKDADFADAVEMDRKKYLQIQAYYLKALGYNATVTFEELIKMDKLLGNFTYKSSSIFSLTPSVTCGQINDMFTMKYTVIEKSKRKFMKLTKMGSQKTTKKTSFIEDSVSEIHQVLEHSFSN